MVSWDPRLPPIDTVQHKVMKGKSEDKDFKPKRSYTAKDKDVVKKATKTEHEKDVLSCSKCEYVTKKKVFLKKTYEHKTSRSHLQGVQRNVSNLHEVTQACG